MHTNFEVPCASKFRAFRSSVRFEVPCVSKFRALQSSVHFEVPCGNPIIKPLRGVFAHTYTSVISIYGDF